MATNGHDHAAKNPKSCDKDSTNCCIVGKDGTEKNTLVVNSVKKFYGETLNTCVDKQCNLGRVKKQNEALVSELRAITKLIHEEVTRR